MRASRIHSRGPAHVEAQLTPLIDMAILLIVFFVLVGQVASAEFVELSLPRTASDAPGRPGDAQRLVVNVVPARDGGAAAYRLGRREFGPDAAGLAALSATLAEAIKAKPALEVNVRADRATAYSWVRPAMDAVADALALSGVDRSRVRVRLVVLPAGGEDG